MHRPSKESSYDHRCFDGRGLQGSGCRVGGSSFNCFLFFLTSWAYITAMSFVRSLGFVIGELNRKCVPAFEILSHT